MRRSKVHIAIVQILLVLMSVLYISSMRENEKKQAYIEELEVTVTDWTVKCKNLEQNTEGLIKDLNGAKDLLLEKDKRVADLEAELQAYEEVSLHYMGEFHCNAYCTEKYPHICGGGNGITASGAPVTAGVSVALSGADLLKMPYGTIIYIEGVGVRIVQDTGGMSSGTLDVAVSLHSDALSWSGQGKHRVWIVNMKGGEQK